MVDHLSTCVIAKRRSLGLFLLASLAGAALKVTAGAAEFSARDGGPGRDAMLARGNGSLPGMAFVRLAR